MASETITRFRAWLAAKLAPQLAPAPEPTFAGALQENTGSRIHDGVDYSQPVILPRGVVLTKELTDYLREDQAQTYQSQFGIPYRDMRSDMPFVPTTEDPLREWDFATRERVLTNCHAAYARNPLANAAVNFTADFVIGNGFNLTCKNPQVEEILQAFIDNSDNQIRKYERQAVIDLQVDGELILRFFKGKDGATVAVPQRPWELEWIKTESGFFRRPETYHFQRYKTEGDAPTGRTETESEDVPADEIQFVAINDHAYELRGRPELYRILPWLKADKEWLENRAMQNKWRGALLWWVSIANGTPAAIASVVQRWRRPPSPGSAYVSSANETVAPLTNPVNGSDAGHDGRAIRLMNIIGLRLPEYFFGDGSMANLATATRQELPALTKFEAFQVILIEQLWLPLFKRVVQNAIDAGLLPEEVEEHDSDGKPVYEEQDDEETPDELPAEPLPNVQQIAKQAMNGNAPAQMGKPKMKKTCKTMDAFDVTYEPVTAQDLTALSAMLSLAVDKAWASNQTASEKLGFDYAREKRLQQGEQQHELTLMAQGKKPILPEMMPRDEGDMNDERQSANA